MWPAPSCYEDINAKKNSIQGCDKVGFGLLALDDTKCAQNIEPSIYVEPPLLVVVIEELRESGKGWCHGGEVMM